MMNWCIEKCLVFNCHKLSWCYQDLNGIFLMLFPLYMIFFKMPQDLQKLEQYLPLLENLVYHVGLDSNSWIMRLTSDLKIRWSSALGSSSLFNLVGPKFFQIDNLQFELSMTLFLYGAMLRKWASEILSISKLQSSFLFYI